jgi:hypothetical protein
MLELEQRMSTDMCTCGELCKAARAVTMLYDNAVHSDVVPTAQKFHAQVVAMVHS